MSFGTREEAKAAAAAAYIRTDVEPETWRLREGEDRMVQIKRRIDELQGELEYLTKEMRTQRWKNWEGTNRLGRIVGRIARIGV